MWQFLTNLSIPRRLLVATILTALISGIVIGTLGGSYIETLVTMNTTVQASNCALKRAAHMQVDLFLLNDILDILSDTSGVSTMNAAHNRKMNALTSDFSSSFSAYQQNYQMAISPQMKSVRDSLQENKSGRQALFTQQTLGSVIKTQWKDYQIAQQRVWSDLQNGASPGTLTRDVAHVNQVYIPLRENLDILVHLTENISQLVAEGNTSKIAPVLFWTIFAILFGTLMVFLISHLINLTITRPLRQLVLLTQRIAEGDTGARAPVTGQDEIDRVALSMNTMLDSIVNLLQNIQFERDSLQSRAEKLIVEVRGLGEGDLRTEAEVTPDTLGFLAGSFNYIIKELSNLVIDVKRVTYEVEVVTGATRSRMTQLVAIGDQQIQDMLDVVNVVEQMAASTRKVTERAQFLERISHKARRAAHSGRQALDQTGSGIVRIHETVHETAEKFQTLAESSRQIDSIVGVIAGIAHQTNRLALDASIQAALAGENGKGFAAVASDIRRLSEQTKNQVYLISSLGRTLNENISTVTEAMRDTEMETTNGTKQAKQAGESLNAIFDTVECQTRAIESINIAAIQQSHFSKDVLLIMQSITDASRESGSSIHETTRNMWQLTRLVERLRTSVGAFKLHNERQTRKIPIVLH
jgi:methyl-accepting chemotaxis protein